jgi:hypothetical protein
MLGKDNLRCISCVQTKVGMIIAQRRFPDNTGSPIGSQRQANRFNMPRMAYVSCFLPIRSLAVSIDLWQRTRLHETPRKLQALRVIVALPPKHLKEEEKGSGNTDSSEE